VFIKRTSRCQHPFINLKGEFDLCCYDSKMSKKNSAHLAKDKGIKDKGVLCPLSVILAFILEPQNPCSSKIKDEKNCYLV
jgi:hypothetical protein